MADTEGKNSQHSENIRKARELLSASKVDPAETLNLVKKLKSQDRAFGDACKLLKYTLNKPATEINVELEKQLNQQLALCTYKDPDLPAALRLDDAFKILDDADPVYQTQDQETLGIAGAIYKRKWEQSNNKLYLERSLSYYLRGYRLGIVNGWHVDQGYNAINAAYVLDLLGYLEQKEILEANGSSNLPEQRFEQADTIRREVLDKISALLEVKQHAWMKQAWWVLVTIGEACFALADYELASSWFKQADALENVPDWERESTARQLASLLRLRSEPVQGTSAKIVGAEEVLREFLGSDTAVLSVMRGKVGLALSGGGFRASLYHIGVLARLAELDLLRHVEVISCVSGGSIIGAHYYLEVRDLLQKTAQDEITKDDYINIISRIEKSFLAGVQSNIRIRILTSLKATFKMLFSAHYSRTNRLGELYEEQIYSRIKDGLGNKERYLNDLIIKPFAEDENFRPKDHNWHRSAKVPILILNATSLNTGHNWQFTASWMGEPPAGIDTEIDAN